MSGEVKIRLHIDQPLPRPAVELGPEQTHYLRHVLRQEPGQAVAHLVQAHRGGGAGAPLHLQVGGEHHDGQEHHQPRGDGGGQPELNGRERGGRVPRGARAHRVNMSRIVKTRD